MFGKGRADSNRTEKLQSAAASSKAMLEMVVLTPPLENKRKTTAAAAASAHLPSGRSGRWLGPALMRAEGHLHACHEGPVTNRFGETS